MMQTHPLQTSGSRSHAAFIASMAILLFTLLFPTAGRAQNDALFSHYFEVPSYYNPAAIGTDDMLHARAVGRLQWVGIDGAPTTFMGVADTPFKLFNKRFGAGLMIQQESAGLYKNLMIGAQLGYKFRFLKGVWTGAIQLGLLDEGFKGSDVFIPDNDDYHNSADEAIPTTDVHGTTFDMGVGLHYTHKYFWAGLSCQHLLSPTVKLQSESGGNSSGETTTSGENVKNFEYTADRTLYFLAGSNIKIKNTLFEVIPTVMVMSNFTFTTGQVTARLRYNRFLTAGVGYRYNDAVTALLGAEFKGFYLGYSFDYSTTAINRASSGSHEIVLGYKMKLDLGEKNKNRHKNIRIM